MRILVVDDDRNILKEIEDWAKTEGIDCVAVPSGVDAIRIMETDPNFDLAVVDLIMPGLHGIDTLQGLKKIKLDLPVILMANPREMKLAERGIKAGAAAILPKPVSFEKLSELVRSLTGKQKKEIEGCLFNEDTVTSFVELLQILIDTPPGEEIFEVLAREVREKFNLTGLTLWVLSRESRKLKLIFPSGEEELDLSLKEEYPDFVEGEEIDKYLPGRGSEDRLLFFIKKRGRVFALMLVEKGDGFHSLEGEFVANLFGIAVNLYWLNESLTRSIDLQAKAEAEADELRTKLARAVTLMEKLKSRMKKQD